MYVLHSPPGVIVGDIAQLVERQIPASTSALRTTHRILTVDGSNPSVLNYFCLFVVVRLFSFLFLSALYSFK